MFENHLRLKIETLVLISCERLLFIGSTGKVRQFLNEKNVQDKKNRFYFLNRLEKTKFAVLSYEIKNATYDK